MKTLDVLKNKRECLEKIVNSEYPTNSNMRKSYERRVHNAINFIDELNYIIDEVELMGDIECKVVPKATLKSEIKKSDFSEIEFDGIYCRMVWAKKYRGKNLMLIYTTSISSL